MRSRFSALSVSCSLMLIPAALVAQSLPAPGLLPLPPGERCTPLANSKITGAQWLDMAAERVLPKSMEGKVLRYRASHDVPLWEQSDRTYEPYIPNSSDTFRWFDAATGVEGRNPSSTSSALTHAQYPFQLYGPISIFFGRDTSLRPIPEMRPFTTSFRLLNPWIILLDWRAHASDVHVTQRCIYRDFPRIVLARGAEKLYVTEADGVPIKLERTEPHYLWGQVKAEYLWGTWWTVRGGGLFPIAAFRQIDGVTYERVGVASGSAQLVSIDSAPKLTIPAVAPMSDRVVIGAEMPDTVRVSSNIFSLVTPAYTETVALVKDTVFLLDATSGEERARNDSTWISRLFPGKHPVVLIVTDLAWPHISSVRFWVARGATIVTHRMSDEFIRRVVARKWSLEPDALEKARATSTLKLKLVGDSLRLAGGALVVHAMHGNSTEGALAVWMPGDKYLWAGDYIQNSATSPYYYDVVKTARALSLKPDKVGAQHIKLTNWGDVDKRVPQ